MCFFCIKFAEIMILIDIVSASIIIVATRLKLNLNWLVYPINKTSVLLSHSKSYVVVNPITTVFALAMFGISCRGIISRVTLSVILDSKVVVTFIVGHLSALVYCLI